MLRETGNILEWTETQQQQNILQIYLQKSEIDTKCIIKLFDEPKPFAFAKQQVDFYNILLEVQESEDYFELDDCAPFRQIQYFDSQQCQYRNGAKDKLYTISLIVNGKCAGT